MRASGEQYSIAAAGYTAVITEVGATLRHLRHDGRDLVAGFGEDEIRPVYRGAVLAPWPNRIADGAYEFGGVRHHVPLNEPARNNALHGLVSWVSWTPVEQASDHVVLGYRLFPQDGYPFRLDLTMSYSVGAGGLACRLTAVNAGDVEAPYGCAPHPYVVAGPGKVDGWSLQLPAATYLEVTPDRLLPVRQAPVEGTSYDFRVARPIGTTFLDHAFTDLTPAADGSVVVRVMAGDSGGASVGSGSRGSSGSSGVELAWDSACPWVQVHTADRPEPALSRSSLAVEPMTCPPDAFNSRTDLVVLRPNDRHEASWTIRAAS